MDTPSRFNVPANVLRMRVLYKKKMATKSGHTQVMDTQADIRNVTMVCQRCSQPIKLSRNLNIKELLEATVMRVQDEGASSSLRELFTEIQSLKRTNEVVACSKEINLVTECFRLLSKAGEVDHPLCTACPDAVLERLKEEIRMAEESHDHYTRLIDQLSDKQLVHKTENIDEELQKLHSEESQLLNELERLDEDMKALKESKTYEKEREMRLNEEEKQYWRDFNEHQRNVLELRDSSSGIELQLQYITEQLNRLKRTSVLNTAFHVWHNGHFATINGLRFGKLPNVPVEWTEINAAWGQTVFLLSTLANLCGISFARYKLIPYGSQSFIQDTESKKKRELPLYTGSRLFSDAKYDSAMVAFLDCLNQFKVHVDRESNGRFVLPYQIDRDRIGDGQEFYSIKMQFNTEERWTKALKFVLTDLRWGMTWVAVNLMNEGQAE